MQTCSRAGTPPSTKPSCDFDMADARVSSSTSGSSSSSSFASPRTVLPSSLAEFALAHSPRSAPPSPSSPMMFMDDPIASGGMAQLRKLRRPSLLGLVSKPSTMSTTSSAPQSPLATSFGPMLNIPQELASPATHLTRGRSKSAARPKANHHHSGSGTPPQMSLDSRPRSPSTPPSRPGVLHRRNNSAGTHFKLPRLLSIQSELANPADAELKSEASFQRLLASNADLPGALVRTPHPRRRDRGRFPEVYLDEDEQPVDESEDDDDEVIRSGSNSNETLPNAARLPSSQGADEFTMDDILDSPARMDIDMGSYGSPPVMSSLFSMKGWRQTPPPTVAPSRIGKRKLDERYEPYPQKRARGISPTSFSNSTPNPYILPANTVPRSPITTAAPRPTSLAASPPIAIPRGGCHTPTPNTSAYAPMMLYGSPIISSPILRPVRGLGLGANGSGSREERERERQVDGAGNGVKRLDLGS
ncbi:hypothetical protein RhiJN_26183 [Ceratobasidium sp. AG-Ba]|nr:hypothetical protein RhiJN_26183 [Ceratobasidium sp. AG-Ba]